MTFSIITPTLQRPSLLATCDSVDAQSYPHWQHIVMVDCETFDQPLLDKIITPQRMILQCETPHRNGGNSCRKNALSFATGDYIIFLDDDNFLADANVLSSISESLTMVGCPLLGSVPCDSSRWTLLLRPSPELPYRHPESRLPPLHSLLA